MFKDYAQRLSIIHCKCTDKEYKQFLKELRKIDTLDEAHEIINKWFKWAKYE